VSWASARGGEKKNPEIGITGGKGPGKEYASGRLLTQKSEGGGACVGQGPTVLKRKQKDLTTRNSPVGVGLPQGRGGRMVTTSGNSIGMKVELNQGKIGMAFSAILVGKGNFKRGAKKSKYCSRQAPTEL